MILCAFITLLYSFGWPFIFGYEDLISKLGFLKQTRALGRFSWLFFYIMNIALVVVVGEIAPKFNKFYLKTFFIIVIVVILGYDSYTNIKYCDQSLNNEIAALNDSKNKTDETQWVNTINVSNFQAILPLPYFHIGSENISLIPKANMHLNSYIVSLKTGLPIIAILGSRISLTQTYENLNLFYEPNGVIPDILNKFKNEKDILVIAKKDSISSEYEKKIFDICEFITETPEFSLYRLSFKKWKDYYIQKAVYVHKTMINKKLYLNAGYFSSDSSANYIFKDFKDEKTDSGFISKGLFKCKAVNYNTIFEDSLLANPNDSLFTISFWLKNFKKDTYSNTSFAIEEYNHGKVNSILYSQVKYHFKQFYKEWALVEHTFKLQNPKDRIKMVIWHPGLSENDVLEVDNVLYRPNKTLVCKKLEKIVLLNNCVYYND